MKSGTLESHQVYLIFCLPGGDMNNAVWWVITTVAGLVITIIGFYLKRTIVAADEHGKAIQAIQLTYVTQDDFKSYKHQSRDDIRQLTDDINDLKERCLSKEDYYRSQAAVNGRLDKIYDLLYEAQKGTKNDHA